MELAFWISVFLVAYPYLFYPLIIIIMGMVKSRPVRSGPFQPTVTILIPAYNEADCIEATISNKLDQNYPSEKLQIIVVSDGSDDGTDDIVRRFSDRGVVLLRREGREGKAAALNAAILQASGEIVVFSDANSLFHSDAIRYMAEDFCDPEVGYITGALGYFVEGNTTAGSGTSAYIRYENILRSAETRIGSIIGVNGGVDAIRRALYVDTPRHLITDFVLPLSVIAAGHRVIFDPRVASNETANSELNSEFRMRVRVALRALQGLSYMRRLLNPLKYPVQSFCLASHKILRYLAFVFLFVALISNIILSVSSVFYQILLAFHLGGYGLAIFGMTDWAPSWLKRLTVVPSYLLMTYAAFALAMFKFLRGDVMAIWKPRAG